MYTDVLSNRFMASKLVVSKARSTTSFNRMLTTPLKVVDNGVVTDPYYRKIGESGHASRGRKKHLGVDIQGSKRGNKSYDDPNRGLPVKAFIRSSIPLHDLNNAMPYNKSKSTSKSDLGLPVTGDASLNGAKIYRQPWIPDNDHAYGGVLGMSCFYSYQEGNEDKELTLYVEFLHLITPEYLPKNADGVIASRQEWDNLGRGIGFGGDMINNKEVSPEFFSSGPLVGYLGATQFPHVHVQCGFFNKRTTSRRVEIRIDPMTVIY
jgi:hypothetical protein